MCLKTRKNLTVVLDIVYVLVAWCVVMEGAQTLPHVLLWLAKIAGFVLVGAGFFGSIFATLSMVFMIATTPGLGDAVTRRDKDETNAAIEWAVRHCYIAGTAFGVLMAAAWALGLLW